MSAVATALASDPAYDIEVGQCELYKVRQAAVGLMNVSVELDELADVVGAEREDPEDRDNGLKLEFVIKTREVDTHCAGILGGLAEADITSTQEVRRRFLGREDRLFAGDEAVELRGLVRKALDEANSLLTVGSWVGRIPTDFEPLDGITSAEDRDEMIRRNLVSTARTFADLSRDVLYLISRAWGARC